MMTSQSINFRPATLIRQIPWSVDKKGALGLLLILMAFSLVGWLYLGQASVITSSTLQIERLQQQVTLVKQQNAEIALEIATLESLDRVEARARALGFEPTNPTTIRYLSVDDYPETVDRTDLLFTQTRSLQDPIWQIWIDRVVAWIAGKPIY